MEPEGIWNGSTTKGRMNPKTNARATTMGRRFSHARACRKPRRREGDSLRVLSDVSLISVLPPMQYIEINAWGWLGLTRPRNKDLPV